MTGDTVGCVKFFDSDLKMLNWYAHAILHVCVHTIYCRYDNLKFGPIVSISFASASSPSKLQP